LIELNPTYAALASDRIESASLFEAAKIEVVA
jgi:hypothetical protein